MAPHSSTLAWKIPWMEEPGRLQSMGHKEADVTERLHFQFSLSRIGEGNGNPLQCSCLENPRDRGAWWAAIYGAAQSRTWLKWLSSSSVSKESTCNVGDWGSIPVLGKSPAGGNSNPFQYFCLENPIDRGALKAAVHRVTERCTWSNNWARTHKK